MKLYFLMYFVIVLLSAACNTGTDISKKQVSKTNQQAPDSNLQKGLTNELAIVDTGQVYFKVNVTKNDTPYISFEGNWPLLLSSNNSSTIQLAASKKLMSITNMLTIYMHGLPNGKVPIAISNREADKASMVMSQVIKGNYDIPILPSEGFLDITKNTGKILSGNFNAKGTDGDKNIFLVTGMFLNVGVNDDSYIK